MGLATIRDTFFGVPIIRTIGFWGSYWGPPTEGNYHICPDKYLAGDHEEFASGRARGQQKQAKLRERQQSTQTVDGGNLAPPDIPYTPGITVH